jgi:hypothetical protein
MSGKKSSYLTDRVFPNEELIVLSLPREYIDPLPGYEDDDDGLGCIAADLLMAMYPSSYVQVVNDKQWHDRVVMLPPHVILRSLLLTRHDNIPSSQQQPPDANLNFPPKERNMDKTNYITTDNLEPIIDYPLDHMSKLEVTHLQSIDVFLKSMKMVRQRAFKHGLIPLYHYTSSAVLPLIIRNGLRMSTSHASSFREGGVCFSMKGPASYGLGSERYGTNMIKDCFGVERMDEFQGRGKLDAIIVYGCHPSVIQQVSTHSQHTYSLFLFFLL